MDYMKVASKIHLSICVRAICVPSSQSVQSIIVKSQNGRNLANFLSQFYLTETFEQSAFIANGEDHEQKVFLKCC